MKYRDKSMGVPASPSGHARVPFSSLRSEEPLRAAPVPNAEEPDYKELLRMDRILAWLEGTSDDQWCVDYCGEEAKGVPGGTRFCVRGHLLVYGAHNGVARGFDDVFHEVWATEFMYYGVNDGHAKQYQQATPKARVMAYFSDLRDGQQPTTYQTMDGDWRPRVSDQKGREAGPQDGTPAERGGVAETPKTPAP